MRTAITFVLLLSATLAMPAAEFKSEKECVTGIKVADRQNRTGTILSAKSSMCEVALADGSKRSYLFWMLHPAGASAETDDKLTAGLYKCTGLLQIRILGPDSYENLGKSGKYHVEPSRKIVFEDGPLSSYTAKLLAGPKIGLNANGSNFYSITCSPERK